MPIDARSLPSTVLVAGRGHIWPFSHHWKEVPWDRATHGPDVTDATDPALTTTPYSTYHTHYRCRCGREIIAHVRALT